MTIHRLLHHLTAAAFCLVLTVGEGGAMGNNSQPQTTADSNYTKAVALIKARQYREALPLLEKAAARDAKNADIQNQLGYAHRNLKNFDAALQHYRIALRIDPEHRGANEYLGELYLETGQLAKAEERLAVLDRACFFGCEEYRELKEKVAAYKARKAGGS